MNAFLNLDKKICNDKLFSEKEKSELITITNFFDVYSSEDNTLNEEIARKNLINLLNRLVGK